MDTKKTYSFFLAGEAEIYKADAGITRQFISIDDNLMTVKVLFEKGAIGVPHTHPHIQSSYIACGKFEVTIAGQTKTLNGGDGFFVGPDILHGCVCIEEGVIIDTFNPARKDFLIERKV